MVLKKENLLVLAKILNVNCESLFKVQVESKKITKYGGLFKEPYGLLTHVTSLMTSVTSITSVKSAVCEHYRPRWPIAFFSNNTLLKWRRFSATAISAAFLKILFHLSRASRGKSRRGGGCYVQCSSKWSEKQRSGKHRVGVGTATTS